MKLKDLRALVVESIQEVMSEQSDVAFNDVEELFSRGETAVTMAMIAGILGDIDPSETSAIDQIADANGYKRCPMNKNTYVKSEDLDESSDGVSPNDEFGSARDEVTKLFTSNSAVVSLSDIEEAAYSAVKDADRAESLFSSLSLMADELAAENGYSAVEGGYAKNQTANQPENDLDKLSDQPGNDLDRLNESKKVGLLRKLISEVVSEIKTENDKSVDESMKSISRMVKEIDKNFSVKKNDAGNYEVKGCAPTQIQIRPMYKNAFDVIFVLNGTDRERKQNLDLKAVKDYIKGRMDKKELNYTSKAFNKAADQLKDVTKKTAGLEELGGIKSKKLTDTKNVNKDYNQKDVSNDDDLPDKPYAEVKDIKTQLSHAESKPKFSPPKQNKEEKRHVMKGGKGKELKLAASTIKRK